MKKRLISIAVVLSIVASLFIVNIYSSAANQCIEDDYKYVSKVVQVGDSNKMIFDSELARVSHKMALDTYKIRYDSNAYDIATTMKDEGFTNIQQSHQFDDYFMGVFSNNFLVGAKTFTVDGKEKHVVAVAFRGTTVDGFDYGDLFTDASVIGVNGYHSGFYAAASKAFDTLYDMKFPSLKDEDDKIMTFSDVVARSGIIGSDYSIVVTGHSLGGAVANIFTGEILGQIAKSNVMCYTFASPKVCSTETALKRNAYNIFNIINTKDIVPDVGYNVFAGTRLGNDFRVTVNDSEEGSHNLKVTYSKAMEQVISNIDSYYPYIHRICYDKVENGNTVTKDELHIHKDSILSGRYGLNFITDSDIVLYANLTLEQTDLELRNLIVNNKTVNAVNNTISVDSLQIGSGKVYSTLLVSGDITSSNGTITTLVTQGEVQQNINGNLNVVNFTNTNPKGINVSNAVNVSGILTNSYGKISGVGMTLLSDGNFGGNAYQGDVTIKATCDLPSKLTGNVIVSATNIIKRDTDIGGYLTVNSGNLTLENAKLNITGKFTLSVPMTVDTSSAVICNSDFTNSKAISGNLTPITVKGIFQNSNKVNNCLITVNKEFANSGTISGGTITSTNDIYNTGTISVDNLNLECVLLMDISGNSITTNNLTIKGAGKINLKTNINISDNYSNNGVKVDDTKIIISSGKEITTDKTYPVLNQTTDLIIDGCTVTVDTANITGGIKLINGAKLVINKSLTAKASSKNIEIDETSVITIKKIANISSYSNIVVNGELTLGSDAVINSTKLSGVGTVNINGDLYGSSLTINKPENVNIIGKTPQIISCSGANFNNLNILNSSRKGITFSSSVNCYGQYNTNNSNISGTVKQK